MRKRKNIFSLCSAPRPVFVQIEPEKVIPPPSIAEGAEVKTLQDLWDEAEDLMQKIQDRMDEIKNWWKSGAMPAEVKAAYDKCAETKNLMNQYMKELIKKGVYSPNRMLPLEEGEREVREKTIKQIDDVFGEFWIEQKKAEKGDDPLDGRLPLFLPDMSVWYGANRKNKKKGPKPGKPVEEGLTADAMEEESRGADAMREEEKDPDRMLPRESPKYWMAVYRDIARKLVRKAANPETEEPLDPEEKNAVMFMSGGDNTRSIILDGRKYVLEKDVPGNFIRIRDYWPASEENPPGTKIDPYICSSGKNKEDPVWKRPTEADIAYKLALKKERDTTAKGAEDIRRLEAANKTLDKDLKWIFSDKAEYGSKLTLKTGTDTMIEMFKQYDGGIKTTRRSPDGEDERIFKELDQCRYFAGQYLAADTEISAQMASPEDQESERSIVINKIAENLSRACLLGVHHKLFREFTGEINDFINKHGILNWRQKAKDAFGGYRVVITDGRLSVIRKNPEYAEYRTLVAQRDRGNLSPEDEEDIPSEPPPKYLTFYAAPPPAREEGVEGGEKIA
jgi:hypothetical protein